MSHLACETQCGCALGGFLSPGHRYLSIHCPVSPLEIWEQSGSAWEIHCTTALLQWAALGPVCSQLHKFESRAQSSPEWFGRWMLFPDWKWLFWLYFERLLRQQDLSCVVEDRSEHKCRQMLLNLFCWNILQQWQENPTCKICLTGISCCDVWSVSSDVSLQTKNNFQRLSCKSQKGMALLNEPPNLESILHEVTRSSSFILYKPRSQQDILSIPWYFNSG